MTPTIDLPRCSAKVFPRQILLPPRYGPNAKGCLLPPWGVKESSLSGSNLSGMNSSGFYHCLGLLCICQMFIPMAVLAGILYPPTSTSSWNERREGILRGGSSLKVSLRHMVRYLRLLSSSWVKTCLHSSGVRFWKLSFLKYVLISSLTFDKTLLSAAR